MTVGTSLKQLFQLCSGKYLKSETSKFKAVNKVCLCWLCQADLTEKRGGGGRGDTEHHGSSRAEWPRKLVAPSLLSGLQEEGVAGGGTGELAPGRICLQPGWKGKELFALIPFQLHYAY